MRTARTITRTITRTIPEHDEQFHCVTIPCDLVTITCDHCGTLIRDDAGHVHGDESRLFMIGVTSPWGAEGSEKTIRRDLCATCLAPVWDKITAILDDTQGQQRQ